MPESPTGKILIKNGTVVNADGSQLTDVFIEGEVIKNIGCNLSVASDIRVIDAKGKYVFPGGLDPHTHLEFEFMGAVSVDDFYRGTRAAVAGGTTTIIDFAIPKPGQTLTDAYNVYRKKADGNVVCDYALHMGITSWNEDVAKEMKYLCENHGVNSFKVFMAYKNMLMLDDANIYQVFLQCQSLGAIPMVHAENGHVIFENAKRLVAQGIKGPEGHSLSRPEDVEAEATNRACMIAENAGSPLYVVHVMSDSAAQMIAHRRKKGSSRIIGEALAVGLGISAPESGDYCVLAAHVMSPPIRADKNNPLLLMKHLVNDSLSTTGSDNCTFTTDQKYVGKDDFTKIPNGVNGLEDRLSIIWEKGVHARLMKPEKFVEITSTNAAKVFNLYPKKGCIQVGSDADIVIWDPNKTRTISAKTHHHACDFNIFEGMEVHGSPDVVLVKGQIAFEDGEVKTRKGWGRYLPTHCFSPYLYSSGKSNVNKNQETIEDIVINGLKFQEKLILNKTINDLSKLINRQVMHVFQRKDKDRKGSLEQHAFKLVLQSIRALECLSARELNVIFKAFAVYEKVDSDIDYVKFVNACESFYRRKQPF